MSAGGGRKPRIAEVAVQVMRRAGETRVSFGDAILDDIAEAAGIRTRHISARWTRVLDGLERAPDLFDKSQGYGFDTRGLSRPVRVFTAKA